MLTFWKIYNSLIGISNTEFRRMKVRWEYREYKYAILVEELQSTRLLFCHTHKEAIESLSVSVSVAPPFLRLGDVDLSLIFSGGKPKDERRIMIRKWVMVIT